MKMLTDEQKLEIVEKYKTGNYSCNDLGKEYNRKGYNIARLLKRRGVEVAQDRKQTHRKYSLNQNYFNKIDTEDKAYFLGLLYADGCNHNCKKISIELQEQDIDMVRLFAKYLKTDIPLYHRKVKRSKSKNDAHGLTISCKKIATDLNRLGCIPRKSLVLKFPTKEQLPPYLIRHFIRGYFDGDGCISSYFSSYKDTKYFTIKSSIASTEEFCTSVANIVKEILNIDLIQYKHNKDSKNTYIIETSGRLDTFNFVEWLYLDSNISLNRKHNKYLTIKEELIKRGYIGDDFYENETGRKLLRVKHRV